MYNIRRKENLQQPLKLTGILIQFSDNNIYKCYKGKRGGAAGSVSGS